MMAKQVAGGLLDLLFPARCPWCDNVIGFTRHTACETELEKVRIPAGMVAVAPETSAHLAGAWACFRYVPPVSDAMLRYKMQKRRELAGVLAPYLVEKYTAEGLSGRFDLILPVPVSAATQRRRGYNQSALLAGALAAGTSLPVRYDLLHKIRETKRQMDLTREERRTNILGAYEADNPEELAGRRVLLVDDVLTTGATANECANTLLLSGAAACGVLCLACA